MTTLPIFEKINDQRKFPFLLFNFNQFFDGLIGMNVLTQLPAAGIYTACNNFGLIEINNFSTKTKKFYLDSRLEVNRFKKDDLALTNVIPNNVKYKSEHCTSGFETITTFQQN